MLQHIAIGFGAAVLSLSAQAAGPGSSGGGTAGYFPGSSQPVLVDLVQLDPSFRPENDPLNPKDILDLTLPARVTGCDHIEIQDTDAYHHVVERLKRWSTTSPIVTALIHEALSEMDWIETPYHQEVCSPETIPNAHAFSSLEGAVVFDPFFGARVSIPVWNAMGTLSRQALVIHEALRQIQLVYRDSMSEDTIRGISALIVLHEPDSSPTLDQADKFGGDLHHSIKLLDRCARLSAGSCAALTLAGANARTTAPEVLATEKQYCPDGKPFHIFTLHEFHRVDRTLDRALDRAHAEHGDKELMSIHDLRHELHKLEWRLTFDKINGGLGGLLSPLGRINRLISDPLNILFGTCYSQQKYLSCN